jgi:hypothetical protein
MTDNQSSRSNAVAVYLYVHFDFEGTELYVAENIPDLASKKMDNMVSSLTVPAHWTATLYSEVNYGGEYMKIYNGTDDIFKIDTLDQFAALSDASGGLKFNDQVSSIKVGVDVDHTGYSHIELAGKYWPSNSVGFYQAFSGRGTPTMYD